MYVRDVADSVKQVTTILRYVISIQSREFLIAITFDATIHRRHGVGTIAHSKSTRLHRHIGVLVKFAVRADDCRLTENLNRVHSFALTAECKVILIGQSSHTWSPELSKTLAGIIVMTDDFLAEELISMADRYVPFLLLGDTDFEESRLSLDLAHHTHFSAGKSAAHRLYDTFLTGRPVEELRCDIQERSA